MRQAPRHASTHRRRAGFTLVELIVAILVLTVGLLATASASALATKLAAAGQLQARAAAIAQARIDQLRSGTCTAMASGSRVDPGTVTETWTVASASNAKIVTVSVAYMLNRRVRTTTYRAFISCL